MSSREARYLRVDVFTDRVFGGNPLAVFPDADGIDGATMQAIAREMNLSETVFCVRPSAPGASFRFRIFTVDRELPLAGHPTVGSVFALAATGRLAATEGSTVVQVELGVGVIPVRVDVRDGDVVHVQMTQRAPRFGPEVVDRELVGAALGVPGDALAPDLPAEVVDTGIPWLLMPLATEEAVASLRPDPAACRELTGVAGTDLMHAFCRAPERPVPTLRTRHVFFGTVTPGEDPATGSAAGCLGAFAARHGLFGDDRAPLTLRVEQGADVGRPSRVDVTVAGDLVEVGGASVLAGEGWLRID
ncbi:MAG: PhzF family phenazine biosynthesis protein [Planctomycetota bacterium]|nr:PhzF family phenazine biosynthesis protein [Planctomycetota bacterium]MDA0933037.1 PhzF family phenazine biosynthesis protein [Planctomycetota bacterium]